MPAMICSSYPQRKVHVQAHSRQHIRSLTNTLAHTLAIPSHMSLQSKKKIEGSQQEQEPAVQHTALMLCQL